jgi:hypothetical protein
MTIIVVGFRPWSENPWQGFFIFYLPEPSCLFAGQGKSMRRLMGGR